MSSGIPTNFLILSDNSPLAVANITRWGYALCNLFLRGGAVVSTKKKAMPPFAVRLKALREATGMTQAALAEAAGLHLSVVFKIEQGIRDDPSWATVRALAKALGVDCTAFDEEKEPGRGKGK
jgi:DNA-binding XRE family transcriptional regulator